MTVRARSATSRGLRALLALALLLGVVAVQTATDAEPAAAATQRTYGGQPLDDVLAAAGEHQDPSCGLTRDRLAAMVMAPNFSETGAPPDKAPSPMTLSRWDTQSALWAFGNPSTPYQRAFWHPGIGLWQFDSAGYWDLTAATAINTQTAARQAAQVMGSRYCASQSSSVEAKMRYAWAPWYGCASGSVDCWGIYKDLSSGGPLRNYVRDESVGRLGGMEARTCRIGGIGEVACHLVDPARAQGYAGFANPNGAPTPISSPFYVFEANAREYRYWLREDSGYGASVVASKPVRSDARKSLTWSTIESGAGALCDVSTGRGACTPFGSLDLVSAGPRSLRVAGWAVDPDSSAPTDVHVYVDGVGTSLVADRTRADVAASYPNLGAAHGFQIDLPAAPGTHEACAYAIDRHGTFVGNALLGCRTVHVASGSPFGSFDGVVTDGPGALRVSGWAIDPDTAAAVDVHVYVDGVGRASIPASNARTDLSRAMPLYGAGHGFSTSIGALGAGPHEVCVAATDAAAPGAPVWLGCRQGVVPGGSPVGSLDVVRAGQLSVRVGGWALDPETADPIDVHLYVDGAPVSSVVANGTRQDVAAAHRGWGAAHGYATDLVPVAAGPHQVCAYAINVGAGGNSLLGCRSFEISGQPFGVLDVVRAGPVSVELRGWVIEPDVRDPVEVHVYVDGVGRANVRADTPRPDVAAAYGGWGPDLGLDLVIPGIPSGTHQVCAYAINVGHGGTQLLDCRNVTVAGGDPFGVADVVAKSGTSLRVSGWMLDPDTADPVDVHLYVDGAGWSIRADRARADVAAAYPTFGPAHGFDRTVTVPADAREACLYLYNVGQGATRQLGCWAL